MNMLQSFQNILKIKKDEENENKNIIYSSRKTIIGKIVSDIKSSSRGDMIVVGFHLGIYKNPKNNKPDPMLCKTNKIKVSLNIKENMKVLFDKIEKGDFLVLEGLFEENDNYQSILKINMLNGIDKIQKMEDPEISKMVSKECIF